jgi:hypothetical protein
MDELGPYLGMPILYEDADLATVPGWVLAIVNKPQGIVAVWVLTVGGPAIHTMVPRGHTVGQWRPNSEFILAASALIQDELRRPAQKDPRGEPHTYPNR